MADQVENQSDFVDRTAGSLLLLGATLTALLAVTLGSKTSEHLLAARDAVYACSGAAAALGLVFLTPPRPKPAWFRYLAPSLATVLICIPMGVGGTSTPAGEILLVWPVLFASYVLPEFVAWATLGVGIAAFGVVACANHSSSTVGLWVEVSSSLVLTTAVVVALHRRADALAAVLSAQARHDPLTGLVNRRGFDEFLEREITGLARHGGMLSLLAIDIDYFKKVNDESGHPAGDAVLNALGAVLTARVRAGDLVARIGGEEFAVLLPACGPDRAAERAEGLRRAVAAESAVWPDPITVSIGVATIPDHAASAVALAAAADTALYAAKGAGRNAVSISVGRRELRLE